MAIGSKVTGNLQGAPGDAIADATAEDIVAKFNTLLARLRALFIIRS